MEAMRQRYGSPDYRAASGVMRDVFVRLLAEQYTDGMAAVDCRVDLVWGEDDTEVPLEVAVRAQPIFPSAALVTLPGIGHLTPTEAPRQLRRAIVGDRP
jgi:pimeloyl-ACP methyl ester carboxylesterase